MLACRQPFGTLQATLAGDCRCCCYCCLLPVDHIHTHTKHWLPKPYAEKESEEERVRERGGQREGGRGAEEERKITKKYIYGCMMRTARHQCVCSNAIFTWPNHGQRRDVCTLRCSCGCCCCCILRNCLVGSLDAPAHTFFICSFHCRLIS